MGLRYRKSINLGGGFRVNLSKSGIGYSWGVKGYRVTKTAKGSVRKTASIPGTGIGYVTESSGKQRSANNHAANTNSVVNNDVSDVKVINAAHIDNMKPAEYSDLFSAVKRLITVYTVSLILGIILIFINPFIALIPICFCAWLMLKKGINLDYDFDEYALEKWNRENAAWHNLENCQKLWYVSMTATTKGKSNAGAEQGAQLEQAKIGKKLPWFLKTDLKPVIIDIKKKKLIFMPDRILVLEGTKLGAVSYADIDFKFGIQPYAGEIGAPKETEIMEYRWLKVNKDGSPDKRFKGNRQIPVYKLGALYMTSDSGLNTMLLASTVSSLEDLETIYS